MAERLGDNGSMNNSPFHTKNLVRPDNIVEGVRLGNGYGEDNNGVAGVLIGG